MQTATDKADTAQEGPATENTAADHPAEIAAHHQGEADVQTAQPDIAHTASIDTNKAPHHIISAQSQLQSRNPLKHQIQKHQY